MKDKKISAVVSVYNEELSLRHFYQVTSGILEKCAWDYEIVFVNDGSQDKSMEILTEFDRRDRSCRWRRDRLYGCRSAASTGKHSGDH